LYPTRRRKDEILEKKRLDKEKRPDKYRKNNNKAVYYIARFLTVLMAMFTVDVGVTIFMSPVIGSKISLGKKMCHS
jgi:hypothetical protein